jgi:hypothetical protein
VEKKEMSIMSSIVNMMNKKTVGRKEATYFSAPTTVHREEGSV